MASAPHGPIKITVGGTEYRYSGEKPRLRYADDGLQRQHFLAERLVHWHGAAFQLAEKLERQHRALKQAETDTTIAWNALADPKTGNWTAAHQRWVRAEDALLRAANEWKATHTQYEEAYQSSTLIHEPDGMRMYQQAVLKCGVAALPRPDSHIGRIILGGETATAFDIPHTIEQRRFERDQQLRQTLQIALR